MEQTDEQKLRHSFSLSKYWGGLLAAFNLLMIAVTFIAFIQAEGKYVNLFGCLIHI